MYQVNALHFFVNILRINPKGIFNFHLEKACCHLSTNFIQSRTFLCRTLLLSTENTVWNEIFRGKCTRKRKKHLNILCLTVNTIPSFADVFRFNSRLNCFIARFLLIFDIWMPLTIKVIQNVVFKIILFFKTCNVEVSIFYVMLYCALAYSKSNFRCVWLTIKLNSTRYFLANFDMQYYWTLFKSHVFV